MPSHLETGVVALLQLMAKIQYKDNVEMTSEDAAILDDIQVKLNLMNCMSDAMLYSSPKP